MSTSSIDSRVVIVEDEPELADLYAEILREEYTVETALDGETALTVIDETTDLVLLDRRLPSFNGDEVLTRLRERGNECPVVMVTAVDPDVGVADLPFEAYLTKPVATEELLEVAEEQLTGTNYEQKIRRYRRVRAKIELFSAEQTDDSLLGTRRFEQLCSEAAILESEINDVFTGYSQPTRLSSKQQSN